MYLSEEYQIWTFLNCYLNQVVEWGFFSKKTCNVEIT